MTQQRPLYVGALLVFGAGWGLMQPLNKIVVEDGFQPFAILTWQAIITLCVVGILVLGRGTRLPRGAAAWGICLQIAILGTLIPNFASYAAVAHLPAGLMAILISTIPIMALPMGVVAGRETATGPRILGLACGVVAVALIALTRDQVSGGAPLAIAVALLAPLCYALNATRIAARGLAGLTPARAYLGAALIMVPVSFTLARATGQDLSLFQPGRWAGSAGILVISVGHTLIYLGFLWLVSQAGAVFASQTAYLTTGFGIFWSATLLGERYPAAILVAGLLMLLGMALVRPSQPKVAPDP
ncbi:MAG: DMT family transporter [Pseudomonadota bacterium]